jgi:hypothetical protein
MLPRLALALVYLTINGLFVLKYGSRLAGFLPAVSYLIAAPALFWFLTRLPSRIFSNRAYVAVVLVFAALMGIVFAAIPQERLRVDRFEMIRLFWDNAFRGINPYTPREIDTNIPGPFPGYFIIALPFYLCREIGLLSLSGFLLFSWQLFRNDAGVRASTVALLLLVASPAFAWEVACRSTIFLNMALVMVLILRMERRSKAGFSNRASFIYGLLTGVVACTRSVTFLVLAPYFIYLWSNHRAPRPVPYITAALGAFGLPFVPLLAYPSFLHGFNPFAVQSSLLPGAATVVIALFAMVGALRTKSFSGFVLLQTLCLFAIAFGYVAIQIARSGWHAVFIGDGADISYFLLAFPFLAVGSALALMEGPTTGVSGRVSPASLHA